MSPVTDGLREPRLPLHNEPSAAVSLALLSVLHFWVDIVAGQLNPLWPTLERHYQLGKGSTFWLLAIWGLSTSFSQLLFGLIGAGPAGRWLVWIGPLAGTVCLGCLGFSTSPIVLVALLTFGGLGIAAFHPEGATLAGNCWPASRSRAMSIFAMGGFLGQSVGPYCSGLVVDRYGLRGLVGGIGIGLFTIATLRLIFRDTRAAPTSARAESARDAWNVVQRQRGLVHLLLAIGTLRVIAASGAPLAIAYWLTSRGFLKSEIGAVQSAFMAGIGLGGLLCAVWVRSHTERFALWGVPLLAVPCLLAIPFASGVWLSFAMGASGLLLGIALPVFISTGQQLLPGSPRVGSSITMGVSWGTGGAFVAALITWCEYRQSFEPAFVVFAVSVIGSSLLCAWLPPRRTEFIPLE